MIQGFTTYFRRLSELRPVLSTAASIAVLASATALTTAVTAFEPAAAQTTPRLKPPAPGLQYFSAADHAQTEALISALRQKKFMTAKAIIAKIDEPLAVSLGQWLYFYARDPNVSITEADAFLDDHGDWPAASRIQSHVEKKLKYSTPAHDVLALFETRDPRTGHGKLQLARALIDKGEADAGVIHLRDAWINHTFSLKDERSLLARYGNFLRPEDHAARVDRLLWERQVTNARRVFSRLTSDERRRANVRAALLLQAKGALASYERLSEADRADAGVMHAAVRYLRRTGEEPRAVAIATGAPASPEALRNASRWWLERRLLMRWAIREKRFADAYAMAAGHGLEPSTEFSAAEFNAGWIALRFLGEPERAATHFKALAATVKSPISLARAYYWQGRAADDASDPALARSNYEAAANYPYTYYGQLAAEKIGGAPAERAFETTPSPSPEELASFSSRPLAIALRMLSELDDDRAFLIFAYHLDDRLDTPGEYLKLAEIANGEGAPHITVRAGKVAVRREAFAPEVSYPLIFVPEEATRFAPEEVILGLSRQESEFNPRAFSHAGARGLMQLIPSTAQLTARKEGLRYSRSALLDDPIYNMTIGAAHLSHLFERYDGSWIMTFAAYNAGPHRVTRWVEDFGDPRTGEVDPVDWVEMIPFSETRNYVQRVLENTQIYRARLNGAPIPGKLASDIERGGAPGRAGASPSVRFAGAPVPLPTRTLQFAASAPSPAPEHTDNEIDAAKAAEDGEAPANALDRKPSRAARRATRKYRARPVTSAPHPESGPVDSESVLTEPDAVNEVTSAAAETESPEKSAETSETSQQAPAPAALEPVSFERIQSPAAAGNAVTAAEAKIAQPAPDDVIDISSDVAEQTAELTAIDMMLDSPQQPADGQTAPDVLNAGTSANASANANVINDAGAPCETYRDYISRVEKDEASAADLNAGMLAELENQGGSSCK